MQIVKKKYSIIIILSLSSLYNYDERNEGDRIPYTTEFQIGRLVLQLLCYLLLNPVKDLWSSFIYGIKIA